MKKVIKLTESDLQRIVKRVLNEDMDYDGDQIPNRLDMDSDGDGYIDYYGTFGDVKFNRSNAEGDFMDYDGDVEEFKTWDEYQESDYPNDPENFWSINSKRKERGPKLGANDPEEGRRWFDMFQKKSGGNPFKVRHKRSRKS
jgi:hypothetical protein|tara:strand:- start:117 stop:542 length:426 start_codon:yes stop_codon:yes gene_type:complete